MSKTAMTILALSAGASLGACGAPTGMHGAEHSAQTATWPKRQAGLWEETLTRDGGDSPTRSARVCLGPGPMTDMAVLGHRLAKGDCQRTLSRASDGTYHFSTVCRMGGGALISTAGVVQGDFTTHYVLAADIRVAGAPIAALDSQHQVKISGRYRGPCPAGMKPGQVTRTDGASLLASAGR
jgi:hypothetical protein